MSWGSDDPRYWGGLPYHPDGRHRHHGGTPYYYGVKMFHWMGWRAYPEDLVHYGWKLAQSIDADPRGYDRCCRIGVHHPGLEVTGYGHMTYMQTIESMHKMRDRVHTNYPPHLGIDLHMGKDIYLAEHVVSDVWAEVDPRMDRMAMRAPDVHRFMGLRSLPLFREAREQSRQSSGSKILLEQATLSDVLEYALKKQEPVQAELRRKRLTRSRLAAELHLAAA